MKLNFNGGSYKVIIPKALVKALKWEEGKELDIELVDGGIVIKLEKEV